MNEKFELDEKFELELRVNGGLVFHEEADDYEQWLEEFIPNIVYSHDEMFTTIQFTIKRVKE